MPTFRVATFNVENLFSRAKVLNFEDNAMGDGWLNQIEELRQELKKETYNGERILDLYLSLREFIDIVEVRGRLFDHFHKKVVATGVADWGGFINFKRDRFTESSRANTARVLRTVNADVACVIEAESRPVLKHFCIERLPKTGRFADYKHIMLIDGNDNRGIDVAIASRVPYGRIHSHIDDTDQHGIVFSRDCLEIQLTHPKLGAVVLLVNHFKSKGYGKAAVSDAKRKRQARRVAKLVKNYNLSKDHVIVAGDLNDTPGSDPLAPLREVKGLHDVLEGQSDRSTYYYKGKGQQIDYLLVSAALKSRLTGVDVERRGIFGIEKHTKGRIKPFTSVKEYRDAASDHGAVWADFTV